MISQYTKSRKILVTNGYSKVCHFLLTINLKDHSDVDIYVGKQKNLMEHLKFWLIKLILFGGYCECLKNYSTNQCM